MFVYARVFVEPVIDRAIEYEDGVAVAIASGGVHEHGDAPHGVQVNIGMGFGVLAFSVAVAALFAVVFCVTHGCLGDLRARTQGGPPPHSVRSSACVVPFINILPNPPAVSLDETIRERTGLYLLMVGAVHSAGSGRGGVGRRLVVQVGARSATLIELRELHRHHLDR